MIDMSVDRLQYLCQVIPPLLRLIPENEFSYNPTPGKWSKKQVLGHLIDSATNNHQRFVRVQFEELPVITYDQDKWNSYSYYHKMGSIHLIALWSVYNQHLTELMKRIPSENLLRLCYTSRNEPVTLAYIINDYVIHLEHHLRQMIDYN